jgi:hypothetical protein
MNTQVFDVRLRDATELARAAFGLVNGEADFGLRLQR